MICDHQPPDDAGAVPLAELRVASVSAGQAEKRPALAEFGPAAKLEDPNGVPSALRRSRFPDGQSWLCLSRVSSAVEGGPGGSRMRELCELCRISGSTLLTNSSSKGQTSTHRRNEEQDFCLLPAGQTQTFLCLFGFLD